MDLFGDLRYSEQVRTFHDLFLEACLPALGAALYFSGGTDSITVLAALMEAGRLPHCFHFVVHGWPSDDLARATAMCKAWQVPLTIAEAPRSALATDVRRLVGTLDRLPAWNPRRTTVIQCCHVTDYLCRSAKQTGFSSVAMGVGGVTDDTKRCAIAYAKDGDAGSDPFRRYTLLMGGVDVAEEVNPINAELWLAQTVYGLRVVRPFEDGAFSEWLLSQPAAVVNYPRMKGLALRAFRWFWKDHPEWWRPRTNMHVGSGMREWHADLLLDPEVNPWAVRSTASLYVKLRNASRVEA